MKSFRMFRSKKTTTQKKMVQFELDHSRVYCYSGPEGEERDLYYPDMTESQILQEHRKQVMAGYIKGSATFKASVEKIYSGARDNYSETELSSGEFSLATTDDDEYVHKMVASEIRGLEELYCTVITDHRVWAIRRVLQSQREKGLRKHLPDIAATVSTRSKNFARLVALGDAEEAKKVSTALAA